MLLYHFIGSNVFHVMCEILRSMRAALTLFKEKHIDFSRKIKSQWIAGWK
jgi:hypothetical protein